jgi:hypothetical protein
VKGVWIVVLAVAVAVSVAAFIAEALKGVLRVG